MNDEVADNIIEASKNSMGQDMMEMDKNIINFFSKRIIDMIKYREQIQIFLKNRMSEVTPNVVELAGENVFWVIYFLLGRGKINFTCWEFT